MLKAAVLAARDATAADVLVVGGTAPALFQAVQQGRVTYFDRATRTTEAFAFHE